MDKKSYKNNLVYNILYKTLTGAKPSRIRFDKIDRFTRTYDGTRHIVFFGGEKYDFIYYRIIYLIGVKSGITYFISHNYEGIKVDSYDSLPLEERLTLHNAIILIKSVLRRIKVPTTIIYI